MQNPKHWRSSCPACGARKDQPCITADGYTAERVHWGRPSLSRPLVKIEGRGKELVFFLHEFTVVADLAGRNNSSFVASKEWPVLFTGTNICGDCGEPYDQRGLLRRCGERHPGRVRA
jgi:hypothetical protein